MGLTARRDAGEDRMPVEVTDPQRGAPSLTGRPRSRQGSRGVMGRSADMASVASPGTTPDVHHPFGGFRDSGSPFKEQGTSGLRFYTRLKTAAVRYTW